MDSNLILAVLVKKLQKWRKVKLTLHRKIGKRNIVKLIMLWKHLVEQKRNKENQRTWVRPIFTELQRYLQGDSNNLIVEMQLQDEDICFTITVECLQKCSNSY